VKTSFKKSSIKVASPLRKGAGTRSTTPKTAPLKTYRKTALQEDVFMGASFGETGLNESPSIIGMGKTAR